MSDLAVWMYGERVGVVSRAVRRSLLFGYTPEALAGGAGRPLLSVAMPTRRGPFRGEVPRTFFDGLLPEGEARRMIAYDFGLDEADVLGLLGAIGRDCAGALVVVPDGEEPGHEGSPEPISETEVAERLRRLRFAPLGIDGRVRASLAGVQEKLLLSSVGNGWGLPVDGTPSTHILKPAHQLLLDSIANEAFCMRIAHHVDVAVADVEIGTFDGVPALVIRRYDRPVRDDRVIRLHQEDLCQAHAIDSRSKYEERGGPSLRRCARTLERWSRGSEELLLLLDHVTLSVLVGNADAHAKNLSLIHEPGGQVRLAPAYDLMATVRYPNVSTVPGMFVNGVRDISAITRSDLVEEATTWGMAPRLAEARVERLLGDAADAIGRAAEDVSPPGDLVELLLARAKTLLG